MAVVAKLSFALLWPIFTGITFSTLSMIDLSFSIFSSTSSSFACNMATFAARCSCICFARIFEMSLWSWKQRNIIRTSFSRSIRVCYSLFSLTNLAYRLYSAFVSAKRAIVSLMRSLNLFIRIQRCISCGNFCFENFCNETAPFRRIALGSRCVNMAVTYRYNFPIDFIDRLSGDAIADLFHLLPRFHTIHHFGERQRLTRRKNSAKM